MTSPNTFKVMCENSVCESLKKNIPFLNNLIVTKLEKRNGRT